MHAFCESPWYLSAKHHVLGACFSLMAPFRTRFSPCEVARTAYVQRLIGCLYILWYCYIPPCRCTAQSDLRTGPGEPIQWDKWSHWLRLLHIHLARIIHESQTRPWDSLQNVL